MASVSGDPFAGSALIDLFDSRTSSLDKSDSRSGRTPCWSGSTGIRPSMIVCGQLSPISGIARYCRRTNNGGGGGADGCRGSVFRSPGWLAGAVGVALLLSGMYRVDDDPALYKRP